jgi:hypothetical protein
MLTLHDWTMEDLEKALDGLPLFDDPNRERAINMVKAEIKRRRKNLARLAKKRPDSG